MLAESEYPEFVVTDADRDAYEVARAGGWHQWIRNHSDIRAVQAGFFFSEQRALRVRWFIENFLYLAPGKPFKLLDYQWRDIIAPIFGWCRSSGKRRFTAAYVEIPKGHGKTLLAAAIGIYMLIGDGRYRADCYAAAADKTQASGVYTEAANLVEHSPLADRLKIIPSTKRVMLLSKKSKLPIGTFRPLSKAYNNQGLSHTHCMIFEELHTFRDRTAFGSLRYATSKVELNSAHNTPLMFSITTAGGDQTSIGWDEHQYAQKFLKNELPQVPLDYYAVIYAVPEDADVFDEETVKLANPGWGLTIDPDLLRSELAKAMASTSEEIIWRRYRCNQWVNADEKPWIPHLLWKQCLRPFPKEELAGRYCYAGLDLASTNDITAMILAFPESDGSFHILCEFFVPSEAAKERQRQNRLTPYLDWIKQGYLTETPGSNTDYDFIRARVGTLSKLYGIKHLALDRLWQGQPLLNDLVADGIDVVPFGQGYHDMTIPVKLFEGLVRAGKFRHDNPILTWMMSNCRVTLDDAGGLKISKKRSPDKVDGIVASCMAIGVSSLDQGSIYETRDPYMLK